MSTLRTQLADAKTALRTAQDTHDRAKLAVKRHMIAQGWKEIGTNDKERDILIDAAIDDDPDYHAASTALRRCQATVDHLQADVDDQIDERRKADRASRDRYSAALERMSIHGGDSPDAALCELVTRR